MNDLAILKARNTLLTIVRIPFRNRPKIFDDLFKIYSQIVSIWDMR